MGYISFSCTVLYIAIDRYLDRVFRACDRPTRVSVPEGGYVCTDPFYLIVQYFVHQANVVV
jgi:hypothetical protein